MAFLILSAILNVLFLIAWLLQAFSPYSLRGEHTYIVLTILMTTSSILSWILVTLKRRPLKTQSIFIFHIPAIVVTGYFLLILVLNPVNLVASLLFYKAASEITLDSPTGQTTIVIKENCDFLACSHVTTAYSNFGIFHKSLELHESNKYLCDIDNAGFEQLKARQANLRWSDQEHQLSWNIRDSQCVIRLS